MTTLQNLLHTCGVDENILVSQARGRCTDWEHWLTPVEEHRPTGEDPGYDDDFQRIREEVNKLSGIDTGLICQLAEKLLTDRCKDLRVITFYIWARLHQDGEAGLAQGLSCWPPCLNGLATACILCAPVAVNRLWSGWVVAV